MPGGLHDRDAERRGVVRVFDADGLAADVQLPAVPCTEPDMIFMRLDLPAPFSPGKA